MFLRYLFLNVVLIFNFSLSFAQLQTYSIQRDSSNSYYNNKQITYGVEKITDTYMFTGNALYNFNSNFGNIKLVESYRGTGIQQQNSSFRDDQGINFEYSYPLQSNILILARQNWTYASDTRNLGMNELQRLNTSGGLRYVIKNNSMVEAYAGFEKNKQLQINSDGFLLNLNANLDNLDLSDFTLRSYITSEYLKLNLNRVNADLDVFVNLSHNYEQNNRLSLGMRYKLMNRDLLTSYDNTNLQVIPIEGRLENRINPDLFFNFNLLDNLIIELNMNLLNVNVGKAYNAYYSNISLSNVRRNLKEFQLGFTGEAKYVSANILESIGMMFNVRNEENLVEKLYDMSSTDEEFIKNQEHQRDNNSARTKLFHRGLFMPGNADTVFTNFSLSIYQYDTPSSDNYDDRDEQSINANIGYKHRFTNNFSAGIAAELQMLHLVFLKSERSALNNWNRVIRLAPEIEWTNKIFSIHPKFEILANYTVYDFEDASGSVKSYSYRQIGYKDTICIYLQQNMSFQFKTSFRYFERGILYWDSFSESPQNSNFESYLRGLVYIGLTDKIRIGAGARYYSLKQSSLNTNSVSGSDFSQKSIGPETIITSFFSDGSSISLQGWYEFQYINNLENNRIPNLFLITTIKL